MKPQNIIPAIPFQWDGDGFIPHPRYKKLCDDNFVVGEKYQLEIREHRSMRSHRHYFAELHDAFQNLPEKYLWLETPEHLRKYVLIKTGYYDLLQISCANNTEAVKLATSLKKDDDYCIILIDNNILSRFCAKSMSRKEMDAKTFQECKNKMIDMFSEMLGVNSTELSGAGARQ